jgi:hypothetical protein
MRQKRTPNGQHSGIDPACRIEAASGVTERLLLSGACRSISNNPAFARADCGAMHFGAGPA